MHETFTAIKISTMTAVRIVAISTNAGSTPYLKPSPNDTTTPTTNCSQTAVTGDFHWG